MEANGYDGRIATHLAAFRDVAISQGAKLASVEENIGRVKCSSEFEILDIQV